MPDMTLIYDTFPINGSATVLNTNADRGSSVVHLICIKSSPNAASTGSDSSADGIRSAISFKSMSIPDKLTADVHTTGVIMPLFIPLCIPSISSF